MRKGVRGVPGVVIGGVGLLKLPVIGVIGKLDSTPLCHRFNLDGHFEIKAVHTEHDPFDILRMRFRAT